jgi:hypothetical protein
MAAPPPVYPNPFDETSIDAEFKQKINVEYLVLKQIDRCNTAAYEGDEGKFNNAVESLLAMLPKENRVRIENEKSKSEYVETIEQPVYQYSCGKPMGTPENPIYRNKKTDWNYDGGEPILVSPTTEEVEVVNYQKLYKMILAELQDVGVTWKIEPRGNVEKKIDPPATPLIRLNDGTMVRLLVEKGLDAVKDNVKIEKGKVKEEKEDLIKEVFDDEDKDNTPDEDWFDPSEEDPDAEDEEEATEEQAESKEQIISESPVINIDEIKPKPKPIIDIKQNIDIIMAKDIPKEPEPIIKQEEPLKEEFLVPNMFDGASDLEKPPQPPKKPRKTKKKKKEDV